MSNVLKDVSNVLNDIERIYRLQFFTTRKGDLYAWLFIGKFVIYLFSGLLDKEDEFGTCYLTFSNRVKKQNSIFTVWLSDGYRTIELKL